MLTMRLIQAGYFYTFDGLPGLLYKYNNHSTVYRPAYWVYSQDNTLFIISRGSKIYPDFETAAIFTETLTDFGTFHTGYYKSALYIWNEVKEYVKYFPGPVKFIGHSLGAAVSQILHIFAANEFPEKFKTNQIPFETYAYAPPPTMNEEACLEIKDHVYSFVNDDDIVPTLSIPNLYKRLTLIEPVISIISTDTLVSLTRNLLKVINITSLMDQALFDMIYYAAPILINSVKEYDAGAPKFVEYPVGTVFQLKLNHPKQLSQCLIDPKEQLNIISISLNCIAHHKSERYVEIVKEILEENSINFLY